MAEVNAIDPKGWGEKFLSFCVAILVGMIALSFAVAVLQSIWGWLIGAMIVAALTWLAIVVIRTRRNHW